MIFFFLLDQDISALSFEHILGIANKEKSKYEYDYLTVYNVLQ